MVIGLETLQPLDCRVELDERRPGRLPVVRRLAVRVGTSSQSSSPTSSRTAELPESRLQPAALEPRPAAISRITGRSR